MPSIFTKTGGRACSLHIVELLLLSGYTVVMAESLAIRYRKLLWKQSATPSRVLVLVLVLRSFLNRKRGTDGVEVKSEDFGVEVKSEDLGVKVKKEYSLNFEELLSKIFQDRKQKSCDILEARLDKVIDSRLGIKNEVKSVPTVPSLSLIYSLLYIVTPTKSKGIDKRCDNASMSTEHWLYWLNEGRSSKLSQKEWNSLVTIIQEMFMLLRWKKECDSFVLELNQG